MPTQHSRHARNQTHHNFPSSSSPLHANILASLSQSQQRHVHSSSTPPYISGSHPGPNVAPPTLLGVPAPPAKRENPSVNREIAYPSSSSETLGSSVLPSHLHSRQESLPNLHGPPYSHRIVEKPSLALTIPSMKSSDTRSLIGRPPPPPIDTNVARSLDDSLQSPTSLRPFSSPRSPYASHPPPPVYGNWIGDVERVSNPNFRFPPVQTSTSRNSKKLLSRHKRASTLSTIQPRLSRSSRPATSASSAATAVEIPDLLGPLGNLSLADSKHLNNPDFHKESAPRQKGAAYKQDCNVTGSTTTRHIPSLRLLLQVFSRKWYELESEPPCLLPLEIPASPSSSRRAFSDICWPSWILHLLPWLCLVLSVATGLLHTYQTFLLGSAFQAFSSYTKIAFETGAPTVLDPAKSKLLRDVGIVAIQLLVAGIVGLALNAIAMGGWGILAEQGLRGIRRSALRALGKREIDWFEQGMGTAKESHSDGNQADEGTSAGSAGLMGRFSRETEDLRQASGQTLPMLVQYLSTMLSCLIVALVKLPLLALVVLSSIPLAFAISFALEKVTIPLADRERDLTSHSAGKVATAIHGIATVKAFNAEQKEVDAFVAIMERGCKAYRQLSLLWGLRLSLTQFLLLAMFVQGFWFGSHLIQTGQADQGTVLLVFWACLLASSSFQMCIPILLHLEKGKRAAAGLADLIDPVREVRTGGGHDRQLSMLMRRRSKSQSDLETGNQGQRLSGQTEVDWTSSPCATKFLPIQSPPPGLTNKIFGKEMTSSSFLKTRSLRKLRPFHFSGEINLRNVTLHYPARPPPSAPALNNVTMYLAASDMTYIVGGSGSGKSTIANVLTGLYQPQNGRIEFDDQPMDLLDRSWMRSHVCCVSQGAVAIFEGTVHDNIAIGAAGNLTASTPTAPSSTSPLNSSHSGSELRRNPGSVTREEVAKAARLAMVHEFVRDLPYGYDTLLSEDKGTNLSGGQRQRIALARARIRDPSVLILDEATSALDITSRLLVHEAVKRWRKGRTTVIITHDLSPIEPDDFVYVMESGNVVQQGFRESLEQLSGPFREMIGSQGCTQVEDGLKYEDQQSTREPSPQWDPLVDRPTPTPEVGGKFLEHDPATNPPVHRSTTAFLGPTEGGGFGGFLQHQARGLVDSWRQSNLKKLSRSSLVPPTVASNPDSKSSADDTRQSRKDPHTSVASLRSVDMSTAALERVAHSASLRRPARAKRQNTNILNSVTEDEPNLVGNSPPVRAKFLQLLLLLWPTIPQKTLLILGLILALISGAFTPVFSSLVGKLLGNLATPGHVVVETSLLILLIAAIDAATQGAKFSLLEHVAMGWITSIRRHSYNLIIRQDKSWFEVAGRGPAFVVQTLVRDAEEARNVIGQIVGQIFLIVAMITVGFLWALVEGWELTLVGLAMAPLFIGAVTWQTRTLAKLETTNKLLRDSISAKFLQFVSNLRAVRAMSLEPALYEDYEKLLLTTYRESRLVAVVVGFGFGLGSSLAFIAEALMFYIGALLIIHGRYTFAKMLEVFSLIIFSLTFAGQIAAYIPTISKALQAAQDLTTLLGLPSEPVETQGKLIFPISGHISFQDVNFAYPSRPHQLALKSISFDIRPGESVGIVGASGSGKSTLAALLQKLYEPHTGTIRLDGQDLRKIDAHYLRDHIGVVSQSPMLFDGTIAENIAYGSDATMEAVVDAARKAKIEGFIQTLPKAYDTPVGEGASLMSGGQTQRLQIARALLRRREILILDECTSALDRHNEALVMDAIMSLVRDCTTVVITHKRAIMQMCSRLIVMDQGRVIQSGAFEDLISDSKGHFARLASAGVWAT